jgi:hypothetical protein
MPGVCSLFRKPCTEILTSTVLHDSFDLLARHFCHFSRKSMPSTSGSVRGLLTTKTEFVKHLKSRDRCRWDWPTSKVIGMRGLDCMREFSDLNKIPKPLISQEPLSGLSSAPVFLVRPRLGMYRLAEIMIRATQLSLDLCFCDPRRSSLALGELQHWCIEAGFKDRVRLLEG